MSAVVFRIARNGFAYRVPDEHDIPILHAIFLSLTAGIVPILPRRRGPKKRD